MWAEIDLLGVGRGATITIIGAARGYFVSTRRTQSLAERRTISQKYGDKFLCNAAHKCNLIFDAQCSVSRTPAVQQSSADSPQPVSGRRLSDWLQMETRPLSAPHFWPAGDTRPQSVASNRPAHTEHTGRQSTPVTSGAPPLRSWPLWAHFGAPLWGSVLGQS